VPFAPPSDHRISGSLRKIAVTTTTKQIAKNMPSLTRFCNVRPPFGRLQPITPNYDKNLRLGRLVDELKKVEIIRIHRKGLAKTNPPYGKSGLTLLSEDRGSILPKSFLSQPGFSSI